MADKGWMRVAVTSWFEVDHCPLADVGLMLVSVTSWSEVNMGQCHLVV